MAKAHGAKIVVDIENKHTGEEDIVAKIRRDIFRPLFLIIPGHDIDPGRLYFAAVPDDETHCVFGYTRNLTKPSPPGE